MNISEYQSLNICGVRFKTSGEILTAYQFGYWLKTSLIDAEKPPLEKIELAGADPVYEKEAPSISIAQRAEWDGAIQIDGKWYRNWKIVEDAEKNEGENAFKLSEIRRKRDSLLVSSDWTLFNDSPLSSEDKAAWAVYRQALRDITQQSIDSIVWPTPPIKAV